MPGRRELYAEDRAANAVDSHPEEISPWFEPNSDQGLISFLAPSIIVALALTGIKA